MFFRGVGAAEPVADNNTETTRIGQQGKIVWRHNLTDDTFYTLKLALLAFDNRVDVNGKQPYDYNHGGIWSPDLFTGQASIYQRGSELHADYVFEDGYELESIEEHARHMWQAKHLNV